ncbi:MAG: cytochrome c biogenesis protein [Myxococcales bacterium]|nr:cytochrome c biogenesis protein [Myxococcales bacterium]
MADSDDSRTPWLLTATIVIAALLGPLTLYAIFVMAPVEQQMGVVQKIFYFHVPAANAMYLGFIVCAVASAVYLARRDERWDALAVAAGEVGMLFCVAVLISGPLWARKAWGVYWTWDPRLTSTLLAGMIFAAYLVLRSSGGGEVERRFAAGLAIVGLIDIPVIKYSVQRWRGTHPTVISSKGGGIHPDMRPALLLGFLFFALLSVALIWTRARLERTRQRMEALEMEAAERGLLEEADA